MDADSSSAIRASPADFFVCDKLSNAKLPYIFEILDGAHVVSSSISFIHVLDPFTGKTVTLEAELQIPLLKCFAVFDFAPKDADGFIGVFHPATRAGVLVPQVGHAGSAVHSAGSNQGGCHVHGFIFPLWQRKNRFQDCSCVCFARRDIRNRR